jgi:PIN domain nuclease of toxin-antitoxin system
MPQAAVHQVLDALALEIVDFTAELAYAAGHLRRSTRSAGLALGDRACLALGQQVGLPVLTSDRRWSDVSLGVEVRQIR